MVEKRRIKSVRKKCGLTQLQVANSIGISLSHYKSIENGFRNATLINAWKLSKLFDVSIEDIFFN